MNNLIRIHWCLVVGMSLSTILSSKHGDMTYATMFCGALISQVLTMSVAVIIKKKGH